MRKAIFGCLAVGVGLVLLLVIIITVTAWTQYNNLVTLQQATDKQWAQVQNVYQRRADLIPNLVNTVKGAADFEKSTLTEVTNARASVGQVKIDPNTAPSDPEQLKRYQEAQAGLSSALSRLLVVAERYPDLKSSQNFLELQAQLEGTENRIAVERRTFNDVVQSYDTAIKRFPTLLIAGMMGFTYKPYFEAAASAQNAPQVNFNFGTPAPAPAAP